VSFRADGCVGHPFVTYLAIAPSHRRRGLARLLISAVAERLGPRLFISTERGNRAMLALLSVEGWREVGEIRDVNRSGSAEVFFVKTFGARAADEATAAVV
jgi:ribosomal protein S18 acetylase RimI-like enzyme